MIDLHGEAIRREKSKWVYCPYCGEQLESFAGTQGSGWYCSNKDCPGKLKEAIDGED